MVFDFDDNNWHNAVLESIFIDRKDPGYNDSIEVIVKWYEDNSRSKLTFKKAYLFKITNNLGTIANETIDTAYIAADDDVDLLDFYQGWNGMVDLVHLKCYVIETLSTEGRLKIVAEGVEALKI